jgi:hypothetical protein
MEKPKKAKIGSSRLVPIASDAAMAGPVADGQLIPVLILDTTSRPEVAELIRVHEHLGPGDAGSQWATSRDDEDRTVLLLNFSRPMELEFGIPFSVESQAILVESMLTAGAVYLQAGSSGDRLSQTLDTPRILVELPDTGFKSVWDGLLKKRMTQVMAARLGVPQRKAIHAAEAVIERMRSAVSFRLRPRGRRSADDASDR